VGLPLARIASLVVGALLLTGVSGADEPYKTMLDDPLTFTGVETLGFAADEAEYRIGVFAPDGDDHPVGRDLVRGVTLAVEQANASGGVNGKPLVMVRRWADDPWGAGSKEVVRMAFDDRVWALIGGPDGETTHVAQQVATKAHLPLIAPVSSDPSLTHTRVPWIYRLPPDDHTQAEELVVEGLAPRDLKRVGIVVSADHDGRIFAEEMKAAMERAQNSPIFELAVDSDLHDPGSLADRARSFAPDALVMRLRPGAVRRLLAALQSVGVDCAVFLPWIPGLRLVEFPPAYDGPVIEVAPFRSRQQCGPYLKLVRSGVRRHGTKPTPAMVYGFDAANLVIEALRRHAGGRADLQRQLTGLSGFWGASGPIRWDNGGGNTAKPTIRVLSTER
jgi:ABC-type branched-subunit amino acid transport system substrate-binding protein